MGYFEYLLNQDDKGIGIGIGIDVVLDRWTLWVVVGIVREFFSYLPNTDHDRILPRTTASYLCQWSRHRIVIRLNRR